MIPVGDFLRRRTTPYVNWTLIAINVAVFVYMLTLDTRPDRLIANLPASQADRFLFDWGFVPACVTDMLGFNPDVSPRVLQQVCPAEGSRNYLHLLTAMF